MILYLLLGTALLVGLILIAQWFANADPKRVAGTIRIVVITSVLAVGLFFLFRGELGLIASLGALLFPLVARWRSLWDMARTAAGHGQGRSSALQTKYLKVVLDHDTGAVAGEVREGRFAGRALQSLALAELVMLLDEVRPDDPASAQVLETYLDRLHGDAWREGQAAAGAGAESRPGSGAMSQAEALRVLGLEPGATSEAIREAHHRLIQVNHPDHGGSTYLAAQINQAKDVLLGS